MITPRLTQRASAGAFVLAAALGLSTASVLPAQSAVVAAAPSATTTAVQLQSASVAYGETSKATVTVDTATNGGAKPTGKVELRISDKVLVADVTNSGKVDFTLPLVGASTTPYAVVATFVPTDAAAFSTSSSAPASVTVTKDATSSAVTARHNEARARIVAKSFVTSAHGQVPTGTVAFVLRRNGVKVATVLRSLNASTDPTRNFARAVFSGYGSIGHYKVIAKYRGGVNFLPSKGAFRIG